MNRGTLFIISAPSGVGKTTLCHAVVNAIPNVVLSVSYTTRSKRSFEQEETDYHFVDASTFRVLLEKGIFLEHAHVFGEEYGTSGLWVEEKRVAGLDVILEIDWQGARQVKAKVPDAQSIFIIPPSLESLRRRLTARHPTDPALVTERLKGLQHDLSHYSEYDYVICNDNFEEALKGLCAIIHANRLRGMRQLAAQGALLKSLLQQT
jgi:guanylate kinase